MKNNNLSCAETSASKIVIAVVHHSLKHGGGGEKVVYDLLHGLDKNKFRPVLCCLYDLGEWGEQLRAEGCRTYQNLIGSRFDLLCVFKLAAILKNERAHILYVTDGFANTIVGRLASFFARTPISILIFHSYPSIIRQGAPLMRRIILELTDIILYPQFQKVIALAETHKRYLNTTKKIPLEKIAVVYNGVNTHQFSSQVDVQAIRSDLKVPESAQIVGMIAGLRRWKAHNLLLTAAAELLRKASNTYFLIVGDGPERSKLEKMAYDLGIIDNVRFLGNVQNVPALLQIFDLSVLCSIHEAFPLVLLESMAAAIPVVATDVGSVSEIVDDGVNGFLIPSGDAAQFTKAMLRVIRDQKLAAKLGEAGRKKVEQYFTVRRMVSRNELLFTSWVNS